MMHLACRLSALASLSLAATPIAAQQKPLVIINGHTQQSPPGPNSILDLTNDGSGATNASGPSTPNCANILDYGGDRTGATFSDFAFDAAVTASQTGKVCVYLPSGTYSFNAPRNITLAASSSVGSITIRGDGPDVTNLNFSTGTTGISITTNATSHSFHIQNLSILAGSYNNSTVGLSIYRAVNAANPAIAAPSDITNVTIRGNDGYSLSNGFGKAIVLNAVSNVNISNTYLHGPNDVTNNNSTCLELVGRTTSNGVVFNITRSGFLTCRQGLVYGSSVEGVTVSQSNFVGVMVGIIVPAGSSDSAQLAVMGSHFNAYQTAIDLQVDPGGVSIIGNYITPNTQVGSSNGIIIKATQDYTIADNVIFGNGSGTAAGVIIGAYGRYSGIIQGNTFTGLTIGVAFEAASQRVTVGPNSFDSSVTTKISNSGTNHIIAATCSGAPTAGFTVTNGIITNC
jgi:hypothetical protein